LCKIIKTFNPQTIIHLGEQRSAPYSMKNSTTKRYTVSNNLNGTHNILCAIVDINKDIHFIHLGTMGVYGYGSIPDTIIPEGYLNVTMKNKFNEERNVDILHPAYPGSIYHMTKTQDAMFFQFFAKNYALKITDLHQGIIWGSQTKETLKHSDLYNRFDYDSDYGTVLNRFIMQSINNTPLTIYGCGKQTRAFIHIENSMDCIELALKNPPSRGDKVKIFNQMTETHTLIDLANLILEVVPKAAIQYIENPRKELVENSLEVKNQTFLDLGLTPIHLTKETILEIYEFIRQHKDSVNNSTILPMSFW
jgi:UDP-sulfoquinovose synthase